MSRACTVEQSAPVLCTTVPSSWASTSLGVYYLPAGPRLAEAHDYGTVEPLTVAACSAPKALASPNIMHTQHLRDNQHRDVENEAHVKTRPAQLVFTEGHPPNHLPKGRYKGAGRRGMYKGRAAREVRCQRPGHQALPQ